MTRRDIATASFGGGIAGDAGCRSGAGREDEWTCEISTQPLDVDNLNEIPGEQAALLFSWMRSR